MKAFILAAGLGTRLKPLTDNTPKALLPVAGIPMLERAVLTLKKAGVNSFVVNAHHHANQIVDFCSSLSKKLALPIAISREDDQLLETGGGLKKAAHFLRGQKPFFVYNADVLTDLDLRLVLKAHKDNNSLVTLCVRKRESSRQFLFNHRNQLVGHEDLSKSMTTWAARPVPDAKRLAFDGIHVLSPTLLDQITETGAFSITKTYLRLAGSGATITAYRSDASQWHDIGSAQKLQEAQLWAQKIH